MSKLKPLSRISVRRLVSVDGDVMLGSSLENRDVGEVKELLDLRRSLESRRLLPGRPDPASLLYMAFCPWETDVRRPALGVLSLLF